MNTVLSVSVALPAAYAFRATAPGRQHLFSGCSATGWRRRVFALRLPALFRHRLFDTRLAVALAHCLFNIPLAVWILEGSCRGAEGARRDASSTAILLALHPHLHPTIAAGVASRPLLLHVLLVELLLAKTLTAVEAKPIAATMTAPPALRLRARAARRPPARHHHPRRLRHLLVRNYIARASPWAASERSRREEGERTGVDGLDLADSRVLHLHRGAAAGMGMEWRSPERSTSGICTSRLRGRPPVHLALVRGLHPPRMVALIAPTLGATLVSAIVAVLVFRYV